MSKFDCKKYTEEVIKFPKNLKTEDEKIDAAVKKYFEFSKQSIESKLICCFVVLSMSINEKRYKSFLMKVGLDEVKNKSQIKKYKVIGANFEKLMNYIDVLPNRWSTVYKLANLSEAKLDSLVKANVLHPNVTASEIDLYVKPQQVIVSITRTILSESLRFRFNQDLTNEQVTELLVTIDDWKKRELIDFDEVNVQILDSISKSTQTAIQTNQFQH